MGISGSSPSIIVSNPAVMVGLGLILSTSASRVDSRDAWLLDVAVAGGRAVTVMFEVVGLDVEAVRLNVDRGDVGFVVVWVGVG